MFGEMLRKLRTKQGKTQKEIAEALGFKTSTYTFYENEKREPDFKTLIALADYFGVSCDFLLRGVQSENINAAHDLGLENGAIEELKIRKNILDGMFTKTLSFLIETPEFWDIGLCMCNYLIELCGEKEDIKSLADENETTVKDKSLFTDNFGFQTPGVLSLSISFKVAAQEKLSKIFDTFYNKNLPYVWKAKFISDTLPVLRIILDDCIKNKDDITRYESIKDELEAYGYSFEEELANAKRRCNIPNAPQD